ncbi:hypothetical protein M514_20483 [Trichuris suis]|uniref:Uncharacterized protein n=1 Tax=Trichuris suis TaxID=68888 RepID=A0A085NDA1_9BILA|nr:hypothetical protein M514_20483 [Trichuris suis]
MPFEQFLTEYGAKYEYIWRGGTQQVRETLENELAIHCEHALFVTQSWNRLNDHKTTQLRTKLSTEHPTNDNPDGNGTIRVSDVMTVALVCIMPFEQFLTEYGAKYEYIWSGGTQQVINNSAQLR